MALETLTLTLTGDGYEYTFVPLQGVDESQRKDAVSIAPPGRPASENILLGLSGMEGEITINFAVWDNGEDRANGTAPVGDFPNDTVVTLEEQRRYLREFIHDPGFDASWTLDHDTGAAFDGDAVFVEEITIPTLQQDSPKWYRSSVRLRRGSSTA